MPLIGGVVLLIQFTFAFHALKTGRPYWWLFVIMAFPVIGCALYYFVEVFPNSREATGAKRAVRTLAKSLDPEKDLRARVADVETCGSVENRIALARECMEHGMHGDAATVYRSCMQGIFANDPDIRLGLAGALARSGESAEALTHTRGLLDAHPAFRPNDVRMVHARALDAIGDTEAALAQYRTLAGVFPGEEGRWLLGATLAKLGHAAESRAVYERMLQGAERQPGHYRSAQREWLDRARRALSGET